MKKNGHKKNCEVVMVTILKRVKIVIFSIDKENSLHLAVLPVLLFFFFFQFIKSNQKSIFFKNGQKRLK